MPITSFKSRNKSRSMLVGNSYYEPGNYYSIATTTVGSGGASDITFSSIPSTYTHLQIRGIGKVVGTSSIAMDVWIQFNTDTGSNYSRHLLAGDSGSGAHTGAGTNTDHITIATFPDNYFGSSFFSSFVCDILDYTNTNKYTTVRSLGGYEVNNTTYNGVKFFSGNWRNTNAITSIKIFVNGKTLDQYSHFALYGIKGS